MDRTYLQVPPADYEQVRSLGADWDDASKRWYIDTAADLHLFLTWLPERPSEEPPLAYTSDQAFVVATETDCQLCRARIEVICLFCKSAVDTETGGAVTDLRAFYVTEMSAHLARLLAPWPHFKWGRSQIYPEMEYFANHCGHCGTAQEDDTLHGEPEAAFFDLANRLESFELTALQGWVEFSGDGVFEP